MTGSRAAKPSGSGATTPSRRIRAGPRNPRRRSRRRGSRTPARAGRPEQIHAGSLAQQLTEAERRGNAGEIARLAHREPGVHLGPHNLARAERGEPLERVAEAVLLQLRAGDFRMDGL